MTAIAGAPGRLSRYALLLGLCLLLYLPGIAAIPVLDRDEARFAQATRQMLETGDFLRIRFQDEARNKKPAGIYWLQAAAVSAFSTPDSNAIWPYRLPSLIGATLAALLLCRLGGGLFRAGSDPPAAARTGVVAAVLLASALGVVAEAHIAKTDAALLAAAVAGQGALGLAYVTRRAGRPVPARIAALFWVAEIVAIYLKGPVVPGLAIVTAATLAIADRDALWLRGLRPLIGSLAVVAAVAPWLIAIEHATAGRFLDDSLGHDFLAKLLGVQESHGAPPFSYLLLAIVTFWPGSLFLVPALGHGWQRRRQPVERFLLAWLVPAWIALELVPTKLPHYVLPLYPALALLAAAALVDGFRVPPAGWLRWLQRAVTALWAVAGLALAALLIVLPLRFDAGPRVAGVLGAVLIVALSAYLLRRPAHPAATAGFCAALALAFVVPAAQATLPRLDRLWLSRSAAGLVARHPPPAGRPLVVVGYAEPSLVFLLGTDLRLATASAGAEALGNGGEALVSGRAAPRFRAALAERGLDLRPLGSVAGLDYSNGQRLVLTLYRATRG